MSVAGDVPARVTHGEKQQACRNLHPAVPATWCTRRGLSNLAKVLRLHLKSLEMC